MQAHPRDPANRETQRAAVSGVIDASELERALVSCGQTAVVAVFRGAPEKARRDLAPRIPEIAASAALSLPDVPADEQAQRSHHFDACVAIAWLAAGSWTEVRKRGTDGLPWPRDLARVLLDRRPSWVGNLAKWLASPRQWGRYWSVLRVLEREGLVEIPKTALYWTTMADAFTRSWGLIGDPERDDATVAQVLRLDRVLLERDVWSMLEVEGAVAEIAQHAKSFPNAGPGLDADLVLLANDGQIPRLKVLEATLEGLARSTPKTVGWFLGLHDRLAARLEEQAQARDSYLHLLSARMGAAVDVGLRGLRELLASRRIDVRGIETHIGPLLASKSKSQALSALRLLEEAKAQEPTAAADIGSAVVQGFGHPSPEVHAATLSFLEQLDAEALAPHTARMTESLDLVAPSLRSRLQALLRNEPGMQPSTREHAPAPEGETLVLDAHALDPAAAARAGVDSALQFARGETDRLRAVPVDDGLAPRLDAATALTPIVDLDELVDLLLRGLEDRIRGVEVELALSAMARMPAARGSADFAERTQALMQRAEQVMNTQGPPFNAASASADLAGLALAWVAGRPPENRYREDDFFPRRLLKLAERLAAGERFCLLGTPTHEGGWIRARMLVARWKEARREGMEPDLEEQIQALLRLAPDHRQADLAEVAEIDGEFGDALRFALGSDRDGPDPATQLWEAAAEARWPRRPGDVHRVEVVSHSWGAMATVRHPQRVPFDIFLERRAKGINPAQGLHAGAAKLWWQPSRAAASWWATVWPACPDAFLAAEIDHVQGGLDGPSVQWSGEWEPLFDPEVPAVPVARMLLLLGLSARHAGVSILARDALVAMIADGRLDGDALAETLRLVLPTNVVAHSRWLAAFREVARLSPLHLWTLREAIAGAVDALPAKPPARACAVLEVLHEWSVEGERAVTGAARAHLQTMTGGKLARLAKSIGELADNPSGRVRRAAGQAALASRLERARLYQARWADPPREQDSARRLP